MTAMENSWRFRQSLELHMSALLRDKLVFYAPSVALMLRHKHGKIYDRKEH